MLNGLDLFSGIGGITLALAPWVRPVAYCENDKYAQTVLLSRQADGSLSRAPIWDDVRTLRSDVLPPVDIIYGGFPCQDISLAGNGAGLDGERSGLFFEVARLVGELRPRFIFLENVPAIRSRGADVVCGRLAELGYDARWDVLSASDVGAPHERERWWLLASDARGVGLWKQQKQKRGSDYPPFPATNGAQRHIAPDIDGEGQQQQEGGESAFRRRPGFRGWDIDEGIRFLVPGLPLGLDRTRALGNAVVPACAREAFSRLMGIKS